ncbi:hypothetical protein NIES22_17400 [Calothrix brevissima NIES-22]|nr:hypothetical protein NIES22_17400 [Calothrix brevissima NIES-22]
MSKLVILKFADGSFEQGFAVTLQIGEECDRPTTEIIGKLPPCPEIPLYYSHWQSSYRRLGNGYRLDADKAQITNVSMTQDCINTSHILRARFNAWLKTEEFRPIREKWLERLMPADEVRVILQAENRQLQRLPWHLWDLLERYPKAEIALASPSYERIHKPRTPNKLVNILAIVGNSQGIDTKADQDLLQSYRPANVCLLVEPERQELTDRLWEKNWDILFFAGHSSSQGRDGSGRIYLNQTDSLTIGELKYALKKAIERGLQLAIFNSCDGLGLAQELADLQIPQMIIMREPVPDRVAQEFLKYFLSSFASGESLYQSVRQARERLQGLENKFPCATWLPVICQNPAQHPVSWQGLTSVKKQFSTIAPIINKRRLQSVLVSSLLMTAVVWGIRYVGMLQNVEFIAYDQMMRSRPDEGQDSRLLLVTIDDADLAVQRHKGEELKGTSLSDESLTQLIVKLQQHQPLAIGLDIYRDFPAKNPALIPLLQNTDNLIGVCKGSDTTEQTKGIASPKEIPKNRLGFSDFIHDRDGVVRRHLLFMTQEAASLCPASYALSTQLAFRYLVPRGIHPTYTANNELQLGKLIVPRLSPRASGYQSIDAKGGQVLLNYRSTKKIAEQVTLTQLLSDQVNPDAIKGKIVIIGVSAKGDFPDYWATPYGNYLDAQMAGVTVQAHMVSQILSAALDGRPLIRVWSGELELIWMWSWAIFGGVLVWCLPSVKTLAIAVTISSGVLYISSLGLLIGGIWVPFIPAALALIGTVGALSFQNHTFKIHNSRLIRENI